MQACMLLEKIRKRFPALEFSEVNIRRLFLIAAMITSKVSEDVTYRNRDWVIIGEEKFSLQEVNEMEREMLFLVDYSCNFSREQFEHFVRAMERRYGLAGPCAPVIFAG